MQKMAAFRCDMLITCVWQVAEISYITINAKANAVRRKANNSKVVSFSALLLLSRYFCAGEVVATK